MSVVRPEYGPTLPELVGPRLATVPRRTKLAVVAVLVLLAVAALAVFLARRDPPTAVVVDEPVPFNLVYDDDALQRAGDPGDATLVLTEKGDRPPMQLVVEPLDLPDYRGDSSAALLGLSSVAIEELRRELPGFVLRSEGRFRVNESTVGYQVTFQSKAPGEPIQYGKRFLLVPSIEPEERPTEGLDVTLVAARSKAIAKADDVGVNGPLKRPLRSIRFGTERP